jgi:Sec-independent protein translocase protein TatA
LPEIGRSVGHGIREFKDSVTAKDEKPELEPPAATDSTAPAATREHDTV